MPRQRAPRQPAAAAAGHGGTPKNYDTVVFMNTDVAWLDTDDGRLAYRDAGTGDPVILLHGGLLDHRMWDEQIPVLGSRTAWSRPTRAATDHIGSHGEFSDVRAHRLEAVLHGPGNCHPPGVRRYSIQIGR